MFIDSSGKAASAKLAKAATALPVVPNARDVTSIAHWGTGNLEVPLTSQADLDAFEPFISAAYEGRG